MAKRTYYVSVANGMIEEADSLLDESNKGHEFEVQATEEEIQDLREAMNKVLSSEETTFKRAYIPYKSADHDAATEHYNDDIVVIYNKIYHIGNASTKKHIDNMGILGRLLTPDYNHEGYEQQKKQ